MRKDTVYLVGSKLEFDVRSNEYHIQIIKKIKSLVSKGALIIFHNLECIYGVLYDLFNLRYVENDRSAKMCYITYENLKDPVRIHPNFRCVLLKAETDLVETEANIEKTLPSPLVNRFQKHILNLKDMTQKSKSLYTDIT